MKTKVFPQQDVLPACERQCAGEAAEAFMRMLAAQHLENQAHRFEVTLYGARDIGSLVGAEEALRLRRDIRFCELIWGGAGEEGERRLQFAALDASGRVVLRRSFVVAAPEPEAGP